MAGVDCVLGLLKYTIVELFVDGLGGFFRMLSRIYRICVIIVIFLLLLNFQIIIYFIYEIEDGSFF